MMNTFVETFQNNDGHWLPWRCELKHDAQNHRMTLVPIHNDGNYYCFTGTAKPGQRPDYGLFGDASGGTASVDVGLASGSFSKDAGNIHIFIAYCPSGDEWLTLFSKAFIHASELTPEGTTIRVPLIESEWPEEASTNNFSFPVDRAYVFSHLNEFGVTHHKPWNGVDDGVLWFDNASIILP